MSYNRFDLEQSIMECWNICEDLKTLTENVVEGDMSKDHIANILTGIEQLYNLRFEKTFRIYEDLVRQRAIISSPNKMTDVPF